MVMICFIAAVVGLSITGFTLMFSSSPYARTSSFGAVTVAGLIVGGLLTAQLNGGRPYGYDLPLGLDRWKEAPPDVEAPAKPDVRRPHEDHAPPMV